MNAKDFTPIHPMDLDYIAKTMPAQVKTLCQEFGRSIIVAGGCLRSIVCREHIADWDLFVPSQQVAEHAIKRLCALFKTSKYWKSGNAFTVRKGNTCVQIITRWTFDSPESAILSFDFSCVRAAIWWEQRPGVADPAYGSWHGITDHDFYPDNAARRLTYTSPIRSEDAGGSMLRVLKYYARGYRMPLTSLAAVIARLAKEIDFKRMDGFRESHLLDDGEVGAQRAVEHELARIFSGLFREVDPNAFSPGTEYLDDVGARGEIVEIGIDSENR